MSAGPAPEPAHLQVLKLQAVAQGQLQGITVNIHTDDMPTAQEGSSDREHALQQGCTLREVLQLVACSHSTETNSKDNAQPGMHVACC